MKEMKFGVVINWLPPCKQRLQAIKRLKINAIPNGFDFLSHNVSFFLVFKILE